MSDPPSDGRRGRDRIPGQLQVRRGSFRHGGRKERRDADGVAEADTLFEYGDRVFEIPAASIDALKTFDIIFIMTQGGPANASETIDVARSTRRG